mgnify:FL=1
MHKLLTAILPMDVDALRILKRLKEEQDVLAANLNYARGMGHVTRDRASTAEVSQREILSVVVPAERADELFAWLFAAADIDRPHGGILFMQPLAETTEYSLPDLPEEAGEPET